MFGISLPELLIIFAIALVVFGPEKLPEIARTLGKLAADLRRNSDSIRREFYNSVYKPADDSKDGFNRAARDLISIKRDLQTDFLQNPLLSAPPPQPPASPPGTLPPADPPHEDISDTNCPDAPLTPAELHDDKSTK